jgi:hypothetical protein
VAGDVEQVNRLWRVDGLEMHADDDIRKLARPPIGAAHQLVEVVVAPGSSLVGRTPRELKFRTRFNAAIVGVHRRGEKVVARIGDVRLNGGDVLLLVIANNSFLQAHRRSRQFLLVSTVGAAEVQLPVSLAAWCSPAAGRGDDHAGVDRHARMSRSSSWRSWSATFSGWPTS